MIDVTLVTGDGIGPEIAEAARRCIDATGAGINWITAEAGLDVHRLRGGRTGILPVLANGPVGGADGLLLDHERAGRHERNDRLARLRMGQLG